MSEILECLRRHGECLDAQIAEETGIPLAIVRERLAGLAASGAVVTCTLTRFDRGRPVEGWLCRVSGYIPPAGPGRKPKSPPG